MDFFAWRARPGGDNCSLTRLQNVEGAERIDVGVSLEEGFPPDAKLEMDPRHPKAMALADLLHQSERLLIASPAVRDFLRNEEITAIEYLPVTILNHKGRVASEEYMIVNPLAVEDCIDREESDLRWNELDPNELAGCLELAFVDAFVPSAPIFRVKHMPKAIFVTEALAHAIRDAGFTGSRLVDLDEFTL